MNVDFFFGPGSRYSYLAAVQLPSVEAKTEAMFNWRVVYSPELISRAGIDPFGENNRRGQYNSEYRTTDVSRWAKMLRVPYVESSLATKDWKRVALWCAAAEEVGHTPVFAKAVMTAIFGKGEAPQSDGDLIALASAASIPTDDLIHAIENGSAAAREARNSQAAFKAGAFGVPTFIVEDGALFWGQDRLPLLIDYLQRQTVDRIGR